MLNEIVRNGFCTGCGVCISEDQSRISKMYENDEGFLVPDLNGVSKENQEKMIQVCPFNSKPKEEVKDEDKLASIFFPFSKNEDFEIGCYEQLYVGFASEYRKTSSSGGIATYIFGKLLEKKIVDFLFVVSEDKGGYKYQFFEKPEQLLNISKTRYIPVTLEELFHVIDSIQGKIAVSGVACFVKAIRLKQYYNPVLKEKIPFIVGIICGGLKSRFYSDYLAQQAGIDGRYFNQDYRLKFEDRKASDYSFGAYDEKKQFHQVRMKTLGDMWGTGLFKSTACDFCDDVTTELADISLGDAWIPPYVNNGLGNSVIVTRTYVANQLIEEGIENGSLNVSILEADKFKMSQKGSYNHRHLSLKYRIEKYKNKVPVLPSNRSRFFKEIPIELKLVQNQRMLIRSKSIRLWKKRQSSQYFDKKLKVDILLLKVYTKLSKKIQKFRR